MATEQLRYQPVASDEKDETTVASSGSKVIERFFSTRSAYQRRNVDIRNWRAFLPWVLHFILFLGSISTGLLASRYGAHDCNPPDRVLGYRRKASTRRFNGTLDRGSPYKGPPSHDVDMAWDRILPLRIMSVPESIIQTLNVSKHSVTTPPYLNLAPGRLAIFDTVHHLHCVRALWKSAYPHYYNTLEKLNPSQKQDYIAHLDHCADMLRQKLMCDANSNLITYNWLEGHSHPHPNFHVENNCRNYDDLVKKAEEWGIHDVPKNGFFRSMWEEVVEFGGGDPPFDPLDEGNMVKSTSKTR